MHSEKSGYRKENHTARSALLETPQSKLLHTRIINDFEGFRSSIACMDDIHVPPQGSFTKLFEKSLRFSFHQTGRFGRRLRWLLRKPGNKEEKGKIGYTVKFNAGWPPLARRTAE